MNEAIDNEGQKADDVGGLFPGVHRVNIEVPTRKGDGCSCVRGARSPCWTSRNRRKSPDASTTHGVPAPMEIASNPPQPW